MSIKVRNVTIGEKTLICAPVIAKDEEGILSDCRLIKKAPADIIEWRADYFKDCNNYKNVIKTAKNIREVCGDTPVIFTYRMKDEGGEAGTDKPITIEEYINLIKLVSDIGCIDIIDVQVMSLLKEDINVSEIIGAIHETGALALASNHHFNMTPSDSDMKELFELMHLSGADILKLAVMPKTSADVIRLLAVTDYVSRVYDEPVITMSMGKLGVISRMAGSLTGSSVTFASVKGESAPGQIPVNKLAEIMELL